MRFGPRWFARKERRAKTGVVALLAFVLFPAHHYGGNFTPTLPEGVPAPVGWERIAGETHFGNPTVWVWYEFYVNPKRPALYQLVRYRIRTESGDDSDNRYEATEKLQWQLFGTNTLRRFECRDREAHLGIAAPCQWRELPPDSAEYRREAQVVIWLYGLHRSLSKARDRGSD